MPECVRGNLLEDSCIGVADLAGTRVVLTLPGILARLSNPTAQTVAFTALQAHQAHAWHAFLVQLGAMACHRAGVPVTDERCRAEGWWRDRLLDLSGGSAEAWRLVVDDLSKPAFLQPPVTDWSEYAPAYLSPCQLDVLVTTKNHDVKTGIGGESHWLFALVTLQTQQGYLGRGNYGVFRMNGASGNRFAVGFSDSRDLGGWFRRDVATLVAHRADTILAGGFVEQSGQSLLWLPPWDGSRESALSHAGLDPWCIEICRRLRLREEEGHCVALQAPSDAERTRIAKIKAASTQKWALQNGYGDPWMARDRENKALTPSEQGFTAAKTVEYLLSSDTTPPPAQTMLPEDKDTDLHWYGRALVRGQGKTNGWHERAVPVPATARRSWGDTRTRAADRARDQLRDLDSLRGQVLRPALLALLPAGGRNVDGRNSDGWITRFDAVVDAAFFPALWDQLDQDPDDARRFWRQTVVDIAKRVLREAQAAVPDGVRKWRALAESQRKFELNLATKPDKSGSFRNSIAVVDSTESEDQERNA